MHDTTDARPGCLHCGASLADATPETVLCESCKDADHARAMNECQQARPDWRDPAALPYLVARFSAALLDKLRAAEAKYGYRNDWLRADWMDDCRAELWRHVEKGDPRDVAAYCAFLWHHGERTVAPSVVADAGAGDDPPRQDIERALTEYAAAASAADECAATLSYKGAKRRESEARDRVLAHFARLTSALDAATRRAEAAEHALADTVVKSTEYGSQDGGFVAAYIIPTGPIHRAIPLLSARGIEVRPGFDGRAALAPSRAVPTEDRT